MLSSLFYAIALQAAATDGTPPPPPPPPPAQPATGNADDNRRICRMTQATGTRLGGRRICRTAAEWRRSQENTIEEVREMQRDSGVGAPAPNTGG